MSDSCGSAESKDAIRAPEDHTEADLCVCICTHNGGAAIGGCLESIGGQTLNRRRWGVLVIDDGSTDDTVEVVKRWHRENASLDVKIVGQPPAGLSVARNRGMEVADSPIVAFIDDDARASAGWLEGLVAAFERFPTAGAVGGSVAVRWECSKPGWWHDDLDEVFNRYRPGDEPKWVEYPLLPYGCNFAVRRDAARSLGGFRSDLGRQGGTLIGGEETDLMLRMIGNGLGVAYWPDARVEHLALPQRLSRGYILRRAWSHGRSLARMVDAYPGLAGHVPGAASCFVQMLVRAPGYRFRLAHWKYWLYRLGYHWESRRTAGRSTGERV